MGRSCDWHTGADGVTRCMKCGDVDMPEVGANETTSGVLKMDPKRIPARESIEELVPMWRGMGVATALSGHIESMAVANTFYACAAELEIRIHRITAVNTNSHDQ